VTFPDQPRGRRARPENANPDWEGPGGVPRGEREFPGLPPVRPRGGRHSAGGRDTGAIPRVPYAAGPQHAPGPQHSREPDHSQGPRHSQGPDRGAGPGWDEPDEREDADDPMAAFSERWRRRGEDAAPGRRSRSRLYLAGAGVAAVIVAVAAYFLTGSGSGSAANSGVGNLITTFLPGELQQVPNACTVVPSSTLSQYLPGRLKMAEPPLNSGAQQQTSCTWTLDSPPVYRVLEVYITPYAPDALVGNGSATFAATFAMAEDEDSLQHPGPKSGQPRALVANIGDLGSSAFSAYQVFSQDSSGSQTVTDIASVYVRYRNVVIQVVVNGLARGSGSGHSYSGASQGPLQAAALAVARKVTAAITR
jgi:hypothetical protein